MSSFTCFESRWHHSFKFIFLQIENDALVNNEDFREDTESQYDNSRPDVPQEVPNWPRNDLQLGQVSGVSVNSKGQPVIFHRGPRVWDMWSFNETHNFLQIDEGPIQENTILTLDPKTGDILHEWGAGLFYMPHGVTMDRHDNYWITDVALHQAFKVIISPKKFK